MRAPAYVERTLGDGRVQRIHLLVTSEYRGDMVLIRIDDIDAGEPACEPLEPPTERSTGRGTRDEAAVARAEAAVAGAGRYRRVQATPSPRKPPKKHSLHERQREARRVAPQPARHQVGLADERARQGDVVGGPFVYEPLGLGEGTDAAHQDERHHQARLEP